MLASGPPSPPAPEGPPWAVRLRTSEDIYAEL